MLKQYNCNMLLSGHKRVFFLGTQRSLKGEERMTCTKTLDQGSGDPDAAHAAAH